MFRIVFLIMIPAFLWGFVAEVVTLKGDVSLIDQKQKRPLQVHDKLEAGMQIHSAAHSKTTLNFVDGTIVNIGPNSRFSVIDYSAGEDPSADFRVDGGSFKILTGKIAKIAPTRFKVRTKTATIGVRGTYFAGFYKEGTLGILYLGHGNGVIVSNDQGEVILDEVGDGVFLRDGHIPPKKEQWKEEQSNDLLRELELNENDIPISAQQTYHVGASLNYFHQNLNETGSPDQRRRDMLAMFNFTSPELYNFRFDASLYHRRSLINNENYDNIMSVLGTANLTYRSENMSAQIGRIELETPLTAIAPIRADAKVSEFASWDERTRMHDWWWEFPTNFEAAYVKVAPREDIRLHVAYIDKMRQANSKEFLDISDYLISSKITNEDNSTKMVLVGAQMIVNQEAKIDLWGYMLQDLFASYYAQVKYRDSFEEGAWYVDTQVLKQDGVGSVQQEIDSWLIGGRLGVEYAGAFSALSMTQTSSQKEGEINNVLTPFDSGPAFTNSYAFRNVKASLNGTRLTNPNSAYGSGTRAYHFIAGYDFNRVGWYGLSCFADYGVYDKEGTKNNARAWGLDVSYFIPKHERWFVNLKYSEVDHADFADQDVSIFRALFGVAF